MLQNRQITIKRYFFKMANYDKTLKIIFCITFSYFLNNRGYDLKQ